jgi:hypothetical protein
MSLWTYLTGILVALVILVTVVQMMRHGRLRERHAIWWLVGGILILIVTIFPATLEFVAGVLGVAIPINLSLFLAVGVLALLALQHCSEITSHEKKLRVLTEEVALLKQRLEESEKGTASPGRPGRVGRTSAVKKTSRRS